jgi:hypothetical protein
MPHDTPEVNKLFKIIFSHEKTPPQNSRYVSRTTEQSKRKQDQLGPWSLLQVFEEEIAGGGVIAQSRSTRCFW